MSAQPEALRLAEIWSDYLPAYHYGQVARDTEQELRRLVAENERLAAEVANRNRRALAGDEAVAALANVHAHYECLEAQRDALLEALHAMLSHTAMLDPSQGFDGFDHSAVNQARAAIKAVEEEA